MAGNGSARKKRVRRCDADQYILMRCIHDVCLKCTLTLWGHTTKKAFFPRAMMRSR